MSPRPSDAGLSVEILHRVEELQDEPWQGCSAATAFFFRRPFLHALHAGGVERAEYRYLVVRQGGACVGAAVLSRFTLSLDLLSGDPRVKALRRLSGKLLDIPMVCCGVPASFGQHHLHLRDEAAREAVFDRVHRIMEKWAADSGAGLLVWKEWAPEQGLAAVARRSGYAVLPTLPDHVLDPLPKSIDAFLGSLRHNYRRGFRMAQRIVLADGVTRTRGRTAEQPVELEVRPFEAGDVPDFHSGYGAVIARTPVRLETYPLPFFEELARSDMGLRLFSVRDPATDDTVSALVLPEGDALWFLLVSKHRPRYSRDLYPLLVRCLVLWSIREGYRSLRLGQTSAYAKQSAGAHTRRLETFIRLRSPWRHRIFKQVAPLLFPETPSLDLRVYRESSRRRDARDVL